VSNSASDLVYVTDGKRHLVCLPYSMTNLHQMAEELGIGRHFFHRDHYDVPARRRDEIEAKCQTVRAREVLKIIGGKRKKRGSS
jgi:hypothetical protein